MICEHDFEVISTAKHFLPPAVDPNEVEDRRCKKCGEIFRAWKEVWAKIDAKALMKAEA